MNLGTLHAAGNLALQLAFLATRKMLGKRTPGLREFLSFYRPDRIFPDTAEDKKLVNQFSRCIACGLCDSLCPFGARPSHLAFVARSVPDFSAVSWNLDACGNCRGCEEICPTKVPIGKLMQFLKAKTQEAQRK